MWMTLTVWCNFIDRILRGDVYMLAVGRQRVNNLRSTLTCDVFVCCDLSILLSVIVVIIVVVNVVLAVVVVSCFYLLSRVYATENGYIVSLLFRKLVFRFQASSLSSFSFGGSFKNM